MEQAKIDQETEKNELIISEKNEGLEKINDIVNNVNEQAKDKKKKKKKKNKNEDERAEHQIDDINNNEGVTTNDPPNFEDEIKWCTTQIKMGIKFNNLDKDQIRESMSVISTLESETAPLVKKRHLMKVIFGDYRKKMKTQSQITKK